MIRVPVTSLDKYAAYLGDEEFPLEVLLRELRGEIPPTHPMERGHAFAKAMEQLHNDNAECTMLVAEGHAFAFTCDVELEVWPRRELKAEKDYGGIVVSARCDRLHGTVIADDKTTSHFSGDAGVEKYIDKKQWRYYLDIFGAQEFVWHIWETREIDINEPKDYPGIKYAWEIFNHHVIRNYRYPELEVECRDFALEFKDFAERVKLYD
jgi:hypothetical protein